jgi:hypothetical protein
MNTELTEQNEAALQVVAHDLEDLAETIRSRSWRGRSPGTLADISASLRAIERRVVAIVGEPVVVPGVDWAAVSAERATLERRAAAMLAVEKKD